VKIGLTFNLKSSATISGGADLPEDAEEEFDSPATIEALTAVLEELGHEVRQLGDGMPLLRQLVDGYRPDLVFNFAEGSGSGRSREARVPAVLEMLGIPYTGSDPLTLATTLDKSCAKQLVRAAGVATPDWLLVDGQPGADFDECRDRLRTFPLPVIVKPAFEGSSKGIHQTSFVDDGDRLLETIEQIVSAYRQPVLVEEFIDGEELTVGIVGHKPREVLGILRVIPVKKTKQPFIYSLEVKRDMSQVRYECPARLSAADTRAVEAAALAVWRALGCRDVCRIDFRLRNHVPYFLEVNPLPGLNPETSDLPIMARALGISHRQLVGRILQAAQERLAESAALRC
jgi:D-alanine-D-alanine ligase